MKAIFENNKEIICDYISVVGGLMTVKSRWVDRDEMGNIFSDPVATQKIITDDGENQTVYEGYTGFEEIRWDKNGTTTVIMSTEGHGTVERLNMLDVDMTKAKEDMTQVQGEMKQAQEDIKVLQETGGTGGEAYGSVLTLAKMEAQKITDDTQALAVKDLYDEWDGNGKKYKANVYLRYKGQLYKTISEHTTQPDWTPDTAHSLYTPVGEQDAGTKDNPIVWVSGMESEEGKYYTDEGVLYIGLEDSKIGLTGQPKDLARYFEAVEE